MTLQNSQAQFSLPMELPALTSSRADSHAKTLAQPENSKAWAKEQGPASGPKSSDLLASYHPPTSSWRTSQTCLVALLTNEADGLAEFSETWPSAGMMRNGKTYRRQPWALPIAESVFGLWPTPRKMMSSTATKKEYSEIMAGLVPNVLRLEAWAFGVSGTKPGLPWVVNPRFVALMSGYHENYSNLP